MPEDYWTVTWPRTISWTSSSTCHITYATTPFYTTQQRWRYRENPVYTYSFATTTSSDTDAGWIDLGYLDDDRRLRDTRAAHIEAARADFQREQRARNEARTSAISRADALLTSMLTPEQAASWLRCGAFELVGSHGGRYRIRRGTVGNIEWLTASGEVGGTLCAHPEMRAGWLPDADVALAQLLALTTDEPAFIAVANVHTGTRPPRRRRRVAA